LLALELQEFSVALNFDFAVTGFETAESDLLVGELNRDALEEADNVPDIDRSKPAVSRRSEGARLFIGDAHACQGDGEVCGVAVEFPTVTTIRVDLVKGWAIGGPRLEPAGMIMAIGSARPLEDATRIAYRDLIRWMVRDYGY